MNFIWISAFGNDAKEVIDWLWHKRTVPLCRDITFKTPLLKWYRRNEIRWIYVTQRWMLHLPIAKLQNNITGSRTLSMNCVCTLTASTILQFVVGMYFLEMKVYHHICVHLKQDRYVNMTIFCLKHLSSYISTSQKIMRKVTKNIWPSVIVIMPGV